MPALYRVDPRLVALAPLPAVVVGAAVATLHGVPTMRFVPNVVAAAFGILVIVFATARLAAAPRTSRPISPTRTVALLFVAVLAVAATLIAPGVDGVHRWLPLGPFTLHPSAVVGPWLLATFATAPKAAFGPLAALLCAAQLIHLAQPDAAQATALALGALPVLVATTAAPTRVRLALALTLLALAIATWFRPDPIQPVPHVEQILDLAAASGPGWLLASLAAAALLFTPFAWPLTPARVALGVYLLTALVVPCAGNFPVPILGAGAGHVLGWYAALGALTAARRAPSLRA